MSDSKMILALDTNQEKSSSFSLEKSGGKWYYILMTNDKTSTTHKTASGEPPHDYFGRKTLGDPLIAADLLRHYADPVIREHVDLDNLQAEPTQFFGPANPDTGLKEVILDVPYVARLHDSEWKSEVLIITEHKSSPNLFVPLQLGVHAFLSLYKRWTDAGRPASHRKFKLPIPIMVLLYCGAEDLPDEIVHLQDIFEHIPESLMVYVPQFRLLIINLRRFSYDNLPGKPETQAVVETMMRAFDGSLAEHLTGVLERFGAIPIDARIRDLIYSIAWFSDRVTDIMPEQIATAVTNVLKGKEGIEMAEVIRKGIFQEGFESGELKTNIRNILAILRDKFNPVPDDIIGELYKRTDATALESLVVHAAHCKSLDEFAEALK
jgi:hypothetical protein